VPFRQKALESTDCNWAIDISTATGSFTRMRTDSAADARQRVGIAGELVSFLKSAFRNERDVASCVGVGWTSHHAGKVGVQPIPVYFLVFEPLQQDGNPRCVRVEPGVAARLDGRDARPSIISLLAQCEVGFAVARHGNRFGLVLSAFMPRGYGVAAVGDILDFVSTRFVGHSEVRGG